MGRGSKFPIAVWWTTQRECMSQGAASPHWPEYLQQQWDDRWGRSGRGRLWISPEFGDVSVADDAIPENDAAGIVVDADGLVAIMGHARVTGSIVGLSGRKIIVTSMCRVDGGLTPWFIIGPRETADMAVVADLPIMPLCVGHRPDVCIEFPRLPIILRPGKRVQCVVKNTSDRAMPAGVVFSEAADDGWCWGDPFDHRTRQRSAARGTSTAM
jgi:hypothetical protein